MGAFSYLWRGTISRPSFFLQEIPMLRTLFLALLLGGNTLLLAQNEKYQLQPSSEESLFASVAQLLALSEKELVELVPVQGGFRFCGSPESEQGAQENNMIWKLEFGEKVQCQFTKTLFPNENYPDSHYLDFPTPSGRVQRFRYHLGPDGKKYWFEARKWFEQRLFLEKSSFTLAQLYAIDPIKNKKAGRYAKLILTRFAELYPDYIITFDYPGQDKKFYTAETYPSAVDERKHDAWRLAKWSWWAYMDVSEQLLRTYDLLGARDMLSQSEKQKIEENLFLPMLQFVARYAPIATTNMHPTLWRAQAIAANVLNIPSLIDTVNKGIGSMLREQFSHEGFWKEVTVSYHHQTASGLTSVFRLLYPTLDSASLYEKMAKVHPALLKTQSASIPFRFPNGHYSSINDSWAYDAYKSPIQSSSSHLLTGIGYGVLGAGKGGDQMQAHLNFNRFHGHDHYANLNLTLFAKGKELLSDIGYTHTIARIWATSSTAHNLVVVNGKSQTKGNRPYQGAGRLLLFQAKDPLFQAIEADATDNYEQEGVSQYRRALIAVGISEKDHYLLDIFNVEGNGRKDWIFHGSADERQKISVKTESGTMTHWKKQPSLLPAGIPEETVAHLFDFKKMWSPYWGHSNFRNAQRTKITKASTVKTTFSFYENPDTGLNTWLFTNPKDTLHLADSWAVRGAKENQGKLDDFLRSSVILTRNDHQTTFAAVHSPFSGVEPVQSVDRIHNDGKTLLIRLSLSNGTEDYLIYQSEHRPFQGKVSGKSLDFEGRIGLVRIQNGQISLKMIDGSRLSFGGQTITSNSYSGELVALNGSALKVNGLMDPKEGEFVLVEHGDGQTSSFRVSASSQQQRSTLIHTDEAEKFTLGDDKTLRMNEFPFHVYPGPHRVRINTYTSTITPK
jgi:hypothetical protein